MINFYPIKFALFGFLFVACNQQSYVNDAAETAATKVSAKPLPDTVSKFKHKSPIYDSTHKYVYLTFDDGPQNGTTTVLDICKKQGVKASFFMVGLHTDKYRNGHALVNEIKNGYPEFLLTNHSYSHANGKYRLFYKHPEIAFDDFMQAQQTLFVPYKIIRLPGNSAWVRNGDMKASSLVQPICSLLDSAGYNIIGWDVEWSFNHKTAYPVQKPEIMAAIVDSAFAKGYTHTPNHLVILSHDRMFRLPQYANKLEVFIALLKQRGYIFETVDNYPKLKPL